MKISFRCYYPEGNHVNHWQELTWAQVPEWARCYMFTHPTCEGISVQAIFRGKEQTYEG